MGESCRVAHGVGWGLGMRVAVWHMMCAALVAHAAAGLQVGAWMEGWMLRQAAGGWMHRKGSGLCARVPMSLTCLRCYDIC